MTGTFLGSSTSEPSLQHGWEAPESAMKCIYWNGLAQEWKEDGASPGTARSAAVNAIRRRSTFQM